MNNEGESNRTELNCARVRPVNFLISTLPFHLGGAILFSNEYQKCFVRVRFGISREETSVPEHMPKIKSVTYFE